MTIKPLFSDRVLAKLRILEQRAWTNTAVGGNTWAITRWTGDGITTPRSQTAVGTITGYIYEQKDVQLVNAQSGTTVGQAHWRLAIVSGSVHVDDVLVSTTDATWKFTVRALDQDVLFQRADVERVQ